MITFFFKWAWKKILEFFSYFTSFFNKKFFQKNFRTSVNLKEKFEKGVNKQTSVKQTSVSMLSMFGDDLTKKAELGCIDACFGREQELSKILEILLRRQKNNPILIGEPGVGKTAIIELLATRIARSAVPFTLQNRKIISLNLAKLLSGAQYRGDFEKRLNKIINNAIFESNIILFIDEIHSLMGLGNNGDLNASNILKPVMARSGFCCIGATTPKEYKDTIEKDLALARRFQTIVIGEPSIEDVQQIIWGIKPVLDAYHNVYITPQAIKFAIESSAKYIKDRFLPDKAIDILDRAAAKNVLLNNNSFSKDSLCQILSLKIKKISDFKNIAYAHGDLYTTFLLQKFEGAYTKSLGTIRSTLKTTCEKKVQNFNENCIKLPAISILELAKLASEKTAKEIFSRNLNEQNFLYEVDELSAIKIESCNLEIAETFFAKNFAKYNLFRIAVFFYKIWQNESKKNYYKNLSSIRFYSIFPNAAKRSLTSYIYRYSKFEPCLLSIKSKLNFKDFFLFDSERYENSNFLVNKPVNDNKFVAEIFWGFAQKIFNTDQNVIFKNNLKKNSYTLVESISKASFHPKFFNKIDVDGFYEDILNTNSFPKKIGITEIEDILFEITGIPVNAHSENDSSKFLQLETLLKNRIVGQEFAVNAVCKALKRSYLGYHNSARPIGSFFFSGPTGVGKTEIVKALAEILFGSSKEMLRFDMSEFAEPHSISKLIGAPPGYAGYDSNTLTLVKQVIKKPSCVILFDEVEKANILIWDTLLQVLDDGRLTDSHQNVANFTETVIIFTSNIGAAKVLDCNEKYAKLFEERTKEIAHFKEKKNNLGKANGTKGAKISLVPDIFENEIFKVKKGNLEIFNIPMEDLVLKNKPVIKEFYNTNPNKKPEDALYKVINPNAYLNKQDFLKKIVFDYLAEYFRPEFLNRLDDIIVFEPISKEELFLICEMAIKQLIQKLSKIGISLNIDFAAKTKIVDLAYNPSLGARPLRRVIAKHIEDPLADEQLRLLEQEGVNAVKKYMFNISLSKDGCFRFSKEKLLNIY